MSRAYLGLGSNVGDRLQCLREALRSLSSLEEVRLLRVSPVYQTEPVGVTDQPQFLNAVAELETGLSAGQLLAHCVRIENELGRDRRIRWGPRTIDIDLLFQEGQACDSGDLALPHPRMLERRFVLQPLADLAPNLMLKGSSVREHLLSLKHHNGVHPFKEGIDLASL